MPDTTGMTDNDLFNGSPVPAIAPAAAPAPIAQSLAPTPAPSPSSQAPPPLPDEPGSHLIARAALAEGDPNNPASQQAVAGVILRRMQNTGQTAAQVLSQPGQFESYQNGKIQSVDPTSPAFQAAMDTTKSVTAGPYDSFFQPQIVAQRGVTPPFDPKAGTMIGTQVFGNSSGGFAAMPEGLTPDQQRIWEDLQTPAPTTPGGKATDTVGAFTAGPNAAPLSSAQAAWYKANTPAGGWSNVPGPGEHQLPYALQAGGPLPQTPGAEYVDLDGVHHVVPGGPVEVAAGPVIGVAQGLGSDLKMSLDKLTGGQASVANPNVYGSDNDALTNPGPSSAAQGQAVLAADAAQQRDYNIREGGNQFAQAGRFVGQALPATAAAAAVPEVEAPAVLGALGRFAAPIATNALRGAAAAATNVGPNSAPVGQQLATGAVGGALIPPLVNKLGSVGAKLAGVASTQIPDDVRALADKAINQYGIPLRGSQIAGSVDPAAAIKDSNLITAPGSGFSANQNAQKTAFTRAVSQTFGADSPKLTPPVMSQARQALGQKYDAFAAAHSIANPAPVQSDLSNVLSDASQVMPSGDLAPLQKQVDNINELIATNGGTLPGDAYQSLVRTGAPLDRAMQAGDSNVRYYAGQIKDALDNGMKQGMTSDEIADFANTNLQYKNLMTVKGLAAKAGIQGEISPVQLAGVVNRSFDDRAFSGAGPLGELADIGQTFMKQPANSNTAQRLGEIAGRNWLPGVLAGAAGGEAATGIGGALVHDPSLAIQLGAGALAAKGAGYGINAAAGVRNGALGGRILASPPGAIRSALSNLPNVTKPIEIPLSALAALHLPSQFPGTAAPVLSNAQ